MSNSAQKERQFENKSREWKVTVGGKMLEIYFTNDDEVNKEIPRISALSRGTEREAEGDREGEA